MKEAGAAADSPEPDVSDEAAAGANNDPVEAEEAPGSGIRSYNAGLGGEPSVHEAEVEADLDAARLVEGPEARHVGTLEPDHRSFSGEPFDATDHDLVLGAGENREPRTHKRVENGLVR